MKDYSKQMKALDIVHLRLMNTGLGTSPFKSPEAVVEHLGAVQAQDFAAAKWAVGLRMQNANDENVEKAFNDGKFLRTHVMRPTWHFIMPEDIRWMLELTAPRIKRTLAPYDPKLGISQEVISQSQAAFAKALEGKKLLTRTELADNLEQHMILARGQRLNHIVAHAELDAVICSGPRRGKQFTYGLLEEIVPKAKKLNREKALAKLAQKYFSGHGPAQVKDFAWWSGLGAKDARIGLELAKANLGEETVEGKTYWFSDKTNISKSERLQAFLLSIYDEYTIGYKDRSSLGDERYFEKLILMGNALTAVMILDGEIVGTWKREIQKDCIEIRLSPFRKMRSEEKSAFDKAAELYGTFKKSSIAVTYK
jgi:hypothetical protein